MSAHTLDDAKSLHEVLLWLLPTENEIDTGTYEWAFMNGHLWMGIYEWAIRTELTRDHAQSQLLTCGKDLFTYMLAHQNYVF